MFTRKISLLCTMCSVFLFFGCNQQTGWYSEYGNIPPQKPSEIQGGFYYPEYNIYGQPDTSYTYGKTVERKNISVLLPLSGPNSDIGKSISKSIEIAFLQHPDKNLSVTFFDLSGDKTQKQGVIMNALASNPDIIIGPIFAEDAALVRSMKPTDLPVLSFTSDASAFGNGVMTMALIPAQSVEAIVKEMDKDKVQRTVIFAPNTASGKLMAGAAVLAANIYDVSISGLFYYDENNSDSIKQVAQSAAMYDARSSANTRAREILSDILIKEKLTAAQKNSINTQLEKISKTDTLGNAPYDSVLFLGNSSDSKTVVSFLRYFDVAARDARFYGSALWDTPDLLNDFNMSGAKFAALPVMSEDFAKLYEQLAGVRPSRLDTFGFDAANLARGMVYSNKSSAAYLLDPSGYAGLDGLFRLRPSGESERALQILELNGGGTLRVDNPAATDFMTPLYNIQSRKISSASDMSLVGDGVNPMDYIKIPDALKAKYRSKTFGANTRIDPGTNEIPADEMTTFLPEDSSDEAITNPDFQPVALDTVDKKLIDSVEVKE